MAEVAEKRREIEVGGQDWYWRMQKAEDVARLDIKRLRFGGMIVHRVYMADDGWCDGWKALHAIVETPYLNRLFKIKWNDFNKGWMKHLEGGGWVIFNG